MNQNKMTSKQILQQLLHFLECATTDDECWYWLHAIHTLITNNPQLSKDVPDNVFRVLYKNY